MSNHQEQLPQPISETQASPLPVSLEWLHAVDPRIFTPLTWEWGRYTNIRFSTPSFAIVSVTRIVAHLKDGHRTLQDEIFFTGEGNGSQFNYEFDSGPNLIEYNPGQDTTDHMRMIIGNLGELVRIPGSRIESQNVRHGLEASFVSVNGQWRSTSTWQPLVHQPPIPVRELPGQ